MKLFVISDIHGATAPLAGAAPAMREADAVIIAGDISHDGDAAGALRVLEHIAAINPRIMAVHGNWDYIEVEELLRAKGYGLHGSGKFAGDTGFFGLGGSSPIPIRKRTEYTEDEIREILERGFESIRGARRTVLVSHVPPKGLRDRTFLGLHAGSRSLRRFIESHPVDLCLCGHIHEAWGIERFGASVIANSGSFKKGRHIIVDIGNDISLQQGRVRA